MHIKTLAAVAAAFSMLVCASSMSAEGHAPAKVTIGNFSFSPATLDVPAGTSLVFVNEDDAPHTVFGSDKDSPLRSPALDTDDQYAVTLSKPGTYRYFCSLHPHMTGVIVVK